MAKVDRETLVALRDRVLAAKGADAPQPGRWERTLDADLFEAFGGPLWDQAYRAAQEPLGCSHEMAAADARLRAPHFTGRLDDALALVDLALPEWWVQIRIGSSFMTEAWCNRAGVRSEIAHGETSALAVLAALLTALTSEPANAR